MKIPCHLPEFRKYRPLKWEILHFSTFKADIGEIMKDSDIRPSSACSLDNFLQDNMHL